MACFLNILGVWKDMTPETLTTLNLTPIIFYLHLMVGLANSIVKKHTIFL